MQFTPLEKRIFDLLTPPLVAMGYTLVRVKMRESAGHAVLEVMAERADDTPMSVEDCALISDTASLKLDAEDPISSRYDLEVLSPGLERPLMHAADFTRFIGAEAKVETMLPVEGQRRFRGMIQSVEGDEVVLATEAGKEITLSCCGMKSAKLAAPAPVPNKFAPKNKKTARK